MRLGTAMIAVVLAAGCQKTAPEPRASKDATERAEPSARAERDSEPTGGLGLRGEPRQLLGKQEPVVNEDYRFRLDPIGPGWMMLDAAEARGLLPEALAGALDLEGQLGGVVFVEQVGNTDIDAFHEHVVEMVEISGHYVESLEKVVHAGRPAIRIVTLEVVEGLSIVRLELIAINQGLAYHVNVWGRADALGDDREPLERFVAAFSFTEGLVRPRALEREVTDADGVGWRLRDGIYEDAVYGLRIEPADDWRVAVGADLYFMNPEARVGLVSETAYVLLIAEKVFYDRRAYSTWAFEQTELGMGISRSGEATVVEIGGKRVSLLRYSAGSLEYLYGIGFHGDTAFQVLAWYLPGVRDRAEAELPAAWGAISLLEPKPWRRLERELSRAPDPQVLVGSGFALRDGVYTDFDNGFTWTKPRGRWYVSAGELARAVNPDAQLVFEDLDAAIFGVVIVEAGTWGQDEYHQAVVGTLEIGPEDEKLASAKRAKLGPLRALATTVRTIDAGISYTYEVITAVRGARAYQLTIYGTTASMKRATKSIRRANAALEFPADPLPAVERAGAAVRHHQMGFAYRPPGEGWRVEELPLAQTYGLTGAVYLFNSDRGFVFVAAFVDPATGSEGSSSLDLFEVMAGQLSAVMPGDVSKSDQQVEFAGREWDHMGLGPIGDYYVTARGGVIYLLAVTGGPEGGGGDLEALRDGFEFIH
jgi:hypothetical protein